MSVQEKIELRLPQSDRVAIVPSTLVLGEFGVAASHDYAAGDLLFTIEGPVLPHPTKYTLVAGPNQHIEPQTPDGLTGFGHYLNHSCDPNVIVRPNHGAALLSIDVIARRAVVAGEELFFDYASSEYDVTVAGTPCACGAEACRGLMHGFKDLPADILERYKAEGVIAPFLLE